MGILKRIVFVVYGLLAILAFGVLGLSWFGPLTYEVTLLMDTEWFSLSVKVLIAVGLLGAFIIVLRGLASSRVESFEVKTPNGNRVNVSVRAVVSRVKKIVETDGTCRPDKVVVEAKKRGNVRVFVRLRPYTTLDVLSKADELHENLREGLAGLCGSELRDISLEFSEPKTEELQSDAASSDVGHAVDSNGRELEKKRVTEKQPKHTLKIFSAVSSLLGSSSSEDECAGELEAAYGEESSGARAAGTTACDLNVDAVGVDAVGSTAAGNLRVSTADAAIGASGAGDGATAAACDPGDSLEDPHFTPNEKDS